MHHCTMTSGPITAHAIGDTDKAAIKAAKTLMGVHVYALSPQELAERKPPLTIGIPHGYKLAGAE